MLRRLMFHPGVEQLTITFKILLDHGVEFWRADLWHDGR